MTGLCNIFNDFGVHECNMHYKLFCYASLDYFIVIKTLKPTQVYVISIMNPYFQQFCSL